MPSRGGALSRIMDRRWGEAEASYHAKILDSLDPDPSAIRLARAKARQLGAANVKFKVGVAQELPFADGYFDVAILSWTL